MSLSSRFAQIAKKKNGGSDKKDKIASLKAASKGKRANLVQAKRTGKAAVPAAQAAKEGKKKAKAQPKKKVKVALGKKGDGKSAKADKKKKNKKNKNKKSKTAEPKADKGALDMEIENYMKAGSDK